MNGIYNLVFTFVMSSIVTIGLSKMDVLLDYETIAIIFLASCPWKFGDTVVSLWGGKSEGRIYSLFGIYQDATGDAFQFFSFSLYQSGYKATQLCGFSLYQLAKVDAFQFFGISLFQEAVDEACQGGGIIGHQSAGGNAVQGIGISLYQVAEHDAAQCCGLSGYQSAGNEALQFVGIALWQRARAKAFQGLGILMCQTGPDVSGQWFGVQFIRRH